MKDHIQRILECFSVEGELISFKAYGSGHINSTKYITVKNKGKECEYILQRINKNVFKEPEKLMENYTSVTEFLRKRIIENGGDPDRETINVVKTKDGKAYAIDDQGEYWRLTYCVTNIKCYDKVERPEQFYDSAVAFGKFQYLLRDYPASTLYETIENFHNTPVRFNNLMAAVKADKCGRAEEVRREIEFCKAREEFAGTLERAREAGEIPLRVTHNDTKLNNILFDAEDGRALCVIDLDTIMPGYSVNDFGDSIRFGATTALEDEADLSKVKFDISLYETYVKGFITGVKDGLTKREIELLPIGAIMMTFECGMRFLTDYLDGDVYFKTSREKHNLDRARNQFKLMEEMEANLDEMTRIVNKYSQK